MSPQGYSSPTGSNRTISSFFSPVEKKKMVPVKNILKSNQDRSFSSPTSGPFSLSIANPFKKQQHESSTKTEEESTRVLRKRKMPSKRVIHFSSDEEEEPTATSISAKEEEEAPRKKRSRIIQISDDEGSDDDDFVDENEKQNERLEGNNREANVQKMAKLYPNIPVHDIEESYKENGYNMVKTVMELATFDGTRKRKTEDVVDMDMRGRAIIEKSNKDEDLLRFFNHASSQDIQDTTGCKPQIADKITQELRPFESVDDLHDKLKREKGMSVKFMNAYFEMNQGYFAVDQIIKEIEQTGASLRKILSIWKGLESTESSRAATPVEGEVDEKAGLHMTDVQIANVDTSSPQYKDAIKGFLTEQPDIISKEMKLKDYQLLGINWMLLLYRKNISGILADEMGLGKTAQVISFLGRLYELGERGPHLIIVPASTIENWLREFERFCPTLIVKIYHGTQQERAEQRYELDPENEEYNVIVTTYNVATGAAEDRSFLKHLACRSIILDEGHMVKNCTSARYKHLMKIKAPFRLLLTGTPLQNNLQELVSLLTFIMPKTFTEYEEEIRSIFKIRTTYSGTTEKNKKNGARELETSVQMLSQKRIARAKQMMTPFVLRRRKADVLKDLPQKFHEIKECDMTETQLAVYNNIISQTKKSYEGTNDMEAQFENMSNIVIHLRKAADHPLLFRHLYTDELLRKMTKDIMKDVKYWDSNEDYVYEDMTVMSDFELNRLCKENKVSLLVIKMNVPANDSCHRQ